MCTPVGERKRYLDVLRILAAFHRGMPWTQLAAAGYSLAWCLVCMALCGGMT